MNKDVIYIEPEDDITDVISRIKASKQKVVALVPPKKLGIMRSAVNIKLIAKTAKLTDKAAVIVTTDPSLIKLSALSGLPVAKTLSSRPMLPSEYINRKKEESEEEYNDDDVEEAETAEAAATEPEETTIDSDEVEKDDAKKSKKKKDKNTEVIPNFDKYRKWIIFGGVGAVLLIVVLVWAFVFAPYAKITVNMKTISSNISENITLVTDEKNKDVKAGKFLLEQIKYEEESSVEFEATGKANKGEKAKGTVNFTVAFGVNGGEKAVPAGTTFTLAGKTYTSNAAKTLSWDGKASSCKNPAISNGQIICYVKDSVDVTATEGGAAYNIEAQGSGSSNASGVSVVSSTAMTGGTDKNVTVVSESDINDAKNQLQNNTEAKEKLYAQIGDGVVKIESSYKVETKDPVSSPKKDEEVTSESKKAKLTAKTIYTIYVVDRTAIDEFINEFESDKLGENDKIYTTGNPFFERFLEGKDGTYTAKLKTTIKFGPEISESSILETAKGKKVGEVKALVKDISSNINDVSIEVSFPWVRSVPSDSNKVEVKITVEE